MMKYVGFCSCRCSFCLVFGWGVRLVSWGLGCSSRVFVGGGVGLFLLFYVGVLCCAPVVAWTVTVSRYRW